MNEHFIHRRQQSEVNYEKLPRRGDPSIWGRCILGGSYPCKQKPFYCEQGPPPLETEKAEVFHCVVAKLLYVAKRARVDLQLALAFLCTRVSKSTQEDWEKLRRVLKYIHKTIDLPRIIGVKDFSVL